MVPGPQRADLETKGFLWGKWGPVCRRNEGHSQGQVIAHRKVIRLEDLGTWALCTEEEWSSNKASGIEPYSPGPLHSMSHRDSSPGKIALVPLWLLPPRLPLQCLILYLFRVNQISSLKREVSQGVIRTFIDHIFAPQRVGEMNCTERMVTWWRMGKKGHFGLLSTLGKGWA